MCGIIAYSGRKEAPEVLLNGLRRLEYRGYDSSGIAVVGNPSIKVVKAVGKVDALGNSQGFSGLRGNTGIAHTRWATHGGVTQENAHPHMSSDGAVAVVHNGIIENFRELKAALKEYVFYSETDTEVIPKLIEQGMREGKTFVDAARDAVARIEGRYAVVALHKDGTMVAARNGSPLVLGVGDGEYFAASDIPAFMQYTKRVVYLGDYDFAVIGKGLHIENLQTGPVTRDVSTIEWDAQSAEKGVFEHYMLKEIAEQYETLSRTLEQDPSVITRLATDVRNAESVVLVAAGTAYHACISGRLLFSRIADKNVASVRSSEFENVAHLIDADTLVLAVSQSGETADTLEAVRMAKDAEAKVVAIVNVAGSTLHRESSYALFTNCGPEIGVASTKAYTAQLALMVLTAYALEGKLDEGRRVLDSARNDVYNLTAVSTREHLKELAETLKSMEHVFTIGRQLEYATAKEAALKIKEVSYIHVEALQAGELKHGTIALIEKGTPCIVFFSAANKRETLSNAHEVRARGAYVVGVGPEKDEAFDYFIKVPETGLCNPILQIIPMQVLAYQLAVLRGKDPDRPRNLAKSVTVK
ncbi:MAG: glutamine--fructose-6-phosphate transaminase (isomerizing) [Candidatus Aenigmatarchaeota archaeon]|nr:MAG: glutamine--fructose-6-phosphate transaminase (isomerizing) [Candidatus Aenigmarchaeota archaeon]